MRIILTAILSLSLFANVHAQNTSGGSERRPADQGTRTADGAGAHQLDNQIAACLLLGNQEEVTLAKFAEQHAKSAEVKDFAKQVVQDHTKAMDTLAKEIPDVATIKLAYDADPRAIRQPSEKNDSIDRDPNVAMLKQIKHECLSLTQKELERFKGADFDRAYLGQQVGAHIAMLAQLRGAKSFASPKLQKVIADGDKVTTEHLRRANEIMEHFKAEDIKTAHASPRGK
jgi:predicted outer membrane protein